MRIALIILLLILCPEAFGQRWSVETSGLDTNLRGISVTSGSDKEKRDVIIWASGSNGIILRSTNGGSSWKQLSVPGANDLDFRDIEAFDAQTAYVMSSGDGGKSRIYKTADGGEHWKLQYSDNRAGFFLDSLACDSRTHCVALSDPVGGKFLVLDTEDGEHWQELPRDHMPAALAGEGAFAASGTAITLCSQGNIYFGTGGAIPARVFRSSDHGRSWAAVDTPIASANASSGIFSVACNGHALVAIGGDYKEPASAKQVAAYSNDLGKTWKLAEQQPGGYRSAVASDSRGNFIAVGLNGTDSSLDAGKHWKSLDAQSFNAVRFHETEAWAVGTKGTIARLKTRSE